MRPSHAIKKGRRYRYYVSAALIDDSVAQGARGWRIPAAKLDAATGAPSPRSCGTRSSKRSFSALAPPAPSPGSPSSQAC